LFLNRCRNVVVQDFALGNENAEADLFVVQGTQTGCNSLRPPQVFSGTLPVRVPVVRLDDWLAKRKFGQVHFMKLDVEGAELETLKGAIQLLGGRPRPVLLVEVQDIRTQPWGYRAEEIQICLRKFGYALFRLLPTGVLEDLELGPSAFDGNCVAWPGELALARHLGSAI
jgi:FkbM family methyltransferase